MGIPLYGQNKAGNYIDKLAPNGAVVYKTSAGAKELAASDSGCFVIQDSATGVSVTLPDIGPDDGDVVGLNYTYLVHTASTDGNAKILSNDAHDTTGDEFIGGLIMGFNQVSSTSNGCGGNMIQAADNDAQVVLDSNATNGGGGVGTWINFLCVAPKIWFITGVVYGVTTSTGADLLQDLS